METTLEVGTRVYYTGDAANLPHWAEVTAVRGGNVTLKTADLGQYPGKPYTYTVPVHHIGHEYHGHCDPRFVTETARNAFYRERAIRAAEGDA